MDFIVHILFSENKNRFYIGFTSNLEERVIRHNQKSKGFTGNVKRPGVRTLHRPHKDKQPHWIPMALSFK